MISRRVFAVLVLLMSSVAMASGAEFKVQSLAGTVPAAPRYPDDSRDEGICKGEGSAADSAYEKALVGAGWIPFFATQQAGGTRVVTAASSQDGQCRPVGLTVFVFRDGKAVGMIAPRDSEGIPEPHLTDAETLLVNMDYRKSDDARCCPTGKARVQISIGTQGVIWK